MKVIVAIEQLDNQGSEKWLVFKPKTKKWEDYKQKHFHNPDVEIMECEVIE